MNLIQFSDPKQGRQVAVVEAGRLWTLNDVATTYELIERAVELGSKLPAVIEGLTGDKWVDYQEVIENGRLLLPVDHPDPYRFWVTGTGLTHLGSADARDKMHQNVKKDETDSSRMFQLGLSGGKPGDSEIGAQPEWFYKGNGHSLVNPGAPLPLAAFSDSGSEEVEVCALFYVAPNGTPYRIGYALGNEFSDHVMERENYLYLAHSKIRPASFGPELLIGELPKNVRGRVSIIRDGQEIWGKPFLTGEENMCHSLKNLEYHHFKYDLFRHPGDLHAHFLGTATLSFSYHVEVQEHDVFKLEAPIFGRPLLNPLKLQATEGISVSNWLLGS